MGLSQDQDTKLADAILEHITENIDVSDIFDDKEIIEYVKDYLDPEGVFGRGALREWALANGFVSSSSAA